MAARILIIDAEPIVRSVVTRILQHEGYNVSSAADVDSAMQVMAIALPDLLMTNVALPGISGHDAMRLFKERYPGLPVLMVSGLPDDDTIREWMTEDGWDVFPKPFSAQDLTNKVKEVLEKAHSRC